MQAYFIFELLAAMLVYCVGLEKRHNFYKKMLITATIGIIFIGIFIVGVAQIPYESIIIAEILLGSIIAILFAVMLFLLWIPFQISFQEALYCATCAYLTEHIVYCIRLIANGLAGQKIADAGSLLYYAIHICVYITFYFIFAKKMIRDKHYSTSAIQSLGLMISVLFLVLFMSLFATYYRFELLHGVYGLFCGIVVMYSQLKQQKQLKMQEELNIQQQLWLRQKTQYQMSKENIDIINQKCHDIKHQIAALKTIDNVEKRQQAIDAVEESVMIYDAILKTGNTILDTVLTEKSLLCNQNNITLTCIADGGLLAFMDTIDLYTLFGNGLDNAIEGVLKLTMEERFISLSVIEKTNLIQIQIENKFAGKLTMRKGFPITDKEDSNYHGFGIKSILQIAQKYQGFITIETANNIFLLRVTIPASQVTTKK